MDMVLVKCIHLYFKIGFLNFSNIMLVDIGIAS